MWRLFLDGHGRVSVAWCWVFGGMVVFHVYAGGDGVQLLVNQPGQLSRILGTVPQEIGR